MALTKVNTRMIDGSYVSVKDFGATNEGLYAVTQDGRVTGESYSEVA